MVPWRFSLIISLTPSLIFLNSATISPISNSLSASLLRKKADCRFPIAFSGKTLVGILSLNVDFGESELDREAFAAHLQISDMMASTRVGTGTLSLAALSLSSAILEDSKTSHQGKETGKSYKEEGTLVAVPFAVSAQARTKFNSEAASQIWPIEVSQEVREEENGACLGEDDSFVYTEMPSRRPARGGKRERVSDREVLSLRDMNSRDSDPVMDLKKKQYIFFKIMKLSVSFDH
ncbi:LOW QUALITY PROTEIN: hypothetical protein HID58_012143 [Brassica napus]|uniref:Uncharacterized protein n=1 Tax=Brassica napus TaxID=3708 RepID=A0ABQ8E077_BRANA|nr:LOW QUALITY PROTEIN: hypothetical protein HID58_012143 [Brassica napus]